MKDLLFMLADLWMIFAGFFGGWLLLRRYGNWLLGLEWIVVATSGTNFLIWALLGGDEGSVLYNIAYFFDAFSRSIGITLILVLGLMRVTHLYRPSIKVEVGVFALGIVAALYLQQFRSGSLHVGPAIYYVVVNLLTTLFLIYFVGRVWKIGAHRLAIFSGLATAAGTVIAVTYDFFPLAGDDAHRTIFYTAALATWGAQLWIYRLAYGALHKHNVATGAEPVSRDHSIVSA